MAYLQGTFEERCQTTGAPTHLSFFTAGVFAMFLILNIPGNLLLILAVALDPHKNLRNPFNYLMANLAVADLIVGTVTNPLSVSFCLKEGLNKKISIEEIRAVHMSYFISCTASVLSLASLAVERYLAICNPHTYRSKVTGKRILLTLGSIWFISLTLPFVYFEVGYITYGFIFVNTAVAVAVAITCFTYAMMLYKSKRRTQYLKNRESTNPANDQDLQVAPTRATNSLHDNAVHLEQKITKMFLVVMVALLCCYGTSAILIYTTSFCESCSCTTLHWFRDLQMVFVIMNSNVNFFCYGLRSPRFRHAFAHILRITKRDQVHIALYHITTSKIDNLLWEVRSQKLSDHLP